MQHRLVNGADCFHCGDIDRQLVGIDEGRDQIGVALAMFQRFMDESYDLVAHFQQFLPLFRREFHQVGQEFGLEDDEAGLDFGQVGLGDIERYLILLTYVDFYFISNFYGNYILNIQFTSLVMILINCQIKNKREGERGKNFGGRVEIFLFLK